MSQDTFPAHLVREDLRDFAGYSSARTSFAQDGDTPPTRVWLNANESGAPSLADPDGTSRRYPAPQPPALVEAFADLWATTPERVVVGRGSDEAIELLIRTLCRPGGDGVVITSPTFGMYAVSARLHGVPVIDVPQADDEPVWRVDIAAVAAAAREHGARVVFLASPGNPTGSVVPLREIAALTQELADQAVVVVDEAYGEFAAQRSAVTLLEEHPTLVVLRTLSKAHALAGARVGIALAHPDLAAVLRRVQAPYPVPEPVTRLALEALGEPAMRATREHVGQVLRLRDQVGRWLRDLDEVRILYTSEANFFLVRSVEPDALLGTLRRAGIAVRDMRHLPALEDALRITIGTGQEMDALRRAVAGATTIPESPDPLSPLVKESPA
ncbi:histidinol-phosphate transaminase [Ornithinimicrobium sp. LYQ92]|uniref:histidinol-phosphate transaminase n=1 Tax=Serinicoccus sp. LYQ92 TaxID=3378798 RepID=UPI003853A310